jgi:hypothetical protein
MRLQDRVRTLAGTATMKPLLVFSTEPEYATEGVSGWPVLEYTGRNAARMTAMSSRFPHVVPLRRIIGARTDQADLFTNGVHFTALGAQAIGGTGGFSTYFASLNTCALQDSHAMWAPVSYCKNASNTYSTTTCDTSADCTGTQTCQAKPCTSDTDCDSSPDAGDSCHTE